MNFTSRANINRIEAKASKLRCDHCAMEWGVTMEDLIECEGLDYEEYDLEKETFLQKWARRWEDVKTVAKKIKAALIPKDKIILIDQDLHHAKKPFGQAHELGHNTIQDHREILFVCSENDLNPKTRKQMEFEANIFAAEALYPKYLLKRIYAQYPLSMHTVLFLKEQSNGSIHSSAIQYVKNSPDVCCLLVFRKSKDIEGKSCLVVEGQINSFGWIKEYRGASLSENTIFKINHPIAHAIITEEIGKIIEIPVKGKSRTFTAHTIFTGYNGFALIF